MPSQQCTEGGYQMPELAMMSKTAALSVQNLVTSVYRTKLAGVCRQVTTTWVKNTAGGQGLYLTVEDGSGAGNHPSSNRYTCKVQMKPWYFWSKHGSKSMDIGGFRIDVYWDLSGARFVCGPEPTDGFYVAIVANEEIVLLLGDKAKEAVKRTKAKLAAIEASLLSRKEHVFGKKHFATKAQLAAPNENGGSTKVHDIDIECQTDATTMEPCLALRIDRQCVLQIQRLAWKFRGNQTVNVGGTTIDIFWDVHNWLFQGQDGGGGGPPGHAMFIFQAVTEKDKDSTKKSKSSGDLASISRLPGARSLRNSRDLQGMSGSSLLLYAWRTE